MQDEIRPGLHLRNAAAQQSEGSPRIEQSHGVLHRTDGPRIVLDSELHSTLAGGQEDMPVTPGVFAHALVTQGEGTLLSPPDSEVLLFGASFRVGRATTIADGRRATARSR
jgi:hypothetical protein